jgi:RNase P/RNase MRP subunit POP5
MTLGFATVDLAISTRIAFNFDNYLEEQYHSIISKSKITSKYEKYALANVLAFYGYPTFRVVDKRVQKAYDSLLKKGIIKIKRNGYYLA